MADTEFQQLEKMRASGGLNPIQQTRYDELSRTGGSSSGMGGQPNLLDQAKQIQQFQVQSNQPAIQSLTQGKTDLEGKYKDLLDSIKGQQGVAQDAQILATNNELGRRGISADSGVAQQQQASALRPITTQYQNLAANTGMQQTQDLSSLAERIAALQSGDPNAAISASLGYSSQQQQAQQAAQEMALRQQAQSFAESQANKQAQPDRYLNVGAGGLFDTQAGKIIQGMQSLKSQLGGSGW